jgi:ATP/ADP translocase
MSIYFFKVANRLLASDSHLIKNFSKAKEDSRTKLSLKESMRLVLSSKYIGYIVLLILCYGLIINILEGPWKDRVKELYPNTIDYANFMGHFNILLGISAVSFMLIGSNILRNMSWRASALLILSMLLL